MPVFKNGLLVKSILTRIAITGLVKKVINRNVKDYATVFLLHRAAEIYEGVYGHKPEEIEQLLSYIKKNRFNVVSLEQIVNATYGYEKLPVNSVAFTMDDGYRDQLEVIAPIFDYHKVPITVFLITGLINGELWPWDAKINWLIRQAKQTRLKIPIGNHLLEWPLETSQERLFTRRELQAICAAQPGEKVDDLLKLLETAVGIQIPEIPPPEFTPATWDQIRKAEGDYIRFAPHTHSHRVLSRLSESEVCDEMKKSSEIVTNETKFGLPIFAYPLGMQSHFGPREMQLAKSLGFSGAFAVYGDYSYCGDIGSRSEHRYILKRFALPCQITEVAWLLTGLEALQDRMVSYLPASFGITDNLKYFSYKKLCPSRTALNAFTRQMFYKLQLRLGKFNSLKRIHGERIERLVFVCRGNVCRSPYAEATAKSLGVSVISCGTDVTNSATAEMMAVRAALLRGQDLSTHMSRSIFNIKLNSSDCLVAMDPSHLSVAQDIAARTGCQVTLLGLWMDSPCPEIQDPYGRSPQAFQLCFDAIEKSLWGLVRYINANQNT
jgi:protein-tyrosine-phosphatase/peptidoglycan/xylan/chitin deacetylase (PgdA/CDA1 family)